MGYAFFITRVSDDRSQDPTEEKSDPRIALDDERVGFPRHERAHVVSIPPAPAARVDV